MTSISLRRASFGYGGRIVIKVGDLNIGNGITCLLGPNGAGKTTLLRGLSGIIEPIKGKVLIDGVDLFGPDADSIRKRIGLLPENAFPYPDMTVREYLEYWAEFYGVSAERVDRTLSMMKIEKIQNKSGNLLSQGQKRRVMLARIFLMDPAVLILDEPTSNLDPSISYELMQLIKDYGHKIPVIYSTHHLLEIERIFDRILFIDNGRIRGDFRKEELSEDIYSLYMKTISRGEEN